MAKKGLEYFPVDTTFDTSVRLLLARFKNSGLGIWVRLLQALYREDGYYMVWDEESAMLLASELSEDVEILNQIVKFCIDKEIFNNSMYEKYNILTSRRIQENYYTVVKRRKIVDVKPDFIIYKQLLTLCKHNDNTSEENAHMMSAENEEMHAESEQVEESRGEYSKVEESTEEHSKSSTDTEPETNNTKLHDNIINLYNNKCISLPPVKQLTKKRKQSINARIRQYGQENVYEMLDKASQSTFLAGQNKTGWTANFDWLFRPNNFIKVLEGNYTNKVSPNNGNLKIIKPNKFHNFEQRTEKYTPEQLEAIGRRNFEKKAKELGLEGKDNVRILYY